MRAKSQKHDGAQEIFSPFPPFIPPSRSVVRALHEVIQSAWALDKDLH